MFPETRHFSAGVVHAGTKAAIKNTMFGLAKQLAQRGIRVNSVAPGPIWTPLQVVGGQLAEIYLRLVRILP
ncbi:hypothetical protein LBHL_23260 [Lactobacillus helveticus]|nr:hypothetical protein NB98_08240 [Lactobacillus helveticus]KGL05085.1 hypothetical protein MZ90_08345 [Lactobacillus helveticus]BCD39769.1 hypothetical protein LBHL_23260 [Lactobacillus helveticus]GFP15527.1 hypothetical protein LHEJCM1120_11560 [Lactobacillus helveticus]CDI64034.1 Short chain dehydrogenase/reductase family oxidoreductase [Lactobacillus helveticus CIRM-BIA 103]